MIHLTCQESVLADWHSHSKIYQTCIKMYCLKPSVVRWSGSAINTHNLSHLHSITQRNKQQLRRHQGGTKVVPIDLDAGDLVLTLGMKSPASLAAPWHLTPPPGLSAPCTASEWIGTAGGRISSVSCAIRIRKHQPTRNSNRTT